MNTHTGAANAHSTFLRWQVCIWLPILSAPSARQHWVGNMYDKPLTLCNPWKLEYHGTVCCCRHEAAYRSWNHTVFKSRMESYRYWNNGYSFAYMEYWVRVPWSAVASQLEYALGIVLYHSNSGAAIHTFLFQQEMAYEPSQKYKENKFIVEKSRILKVNGWS